MKRSLRLAQLGFGIFLASAGLAEASPTSAPRPAPMPTCAVPQIVSPNALSIERPAAVVKNGQLFLIELGSNPSTGYRWEIVDPLAPRPFSPYGSAFRDGAPARPAGQAPVVGFPGEDIWVFRATTVGTSVLTMRYAPPGKKGSGATTQTFTIQVVPNTMIC